jgi:hypothetical protein
LFGLKKGGIMITVQLIDEVKNKISELSTEYRQSPGIILSEDDVKCHLFSKLLLLFNNSMSTSDNGILANPLHSEIKFLDSNGHLSLRPDITIIDPCCLTIKRSDVIDISRKGFVFWGGSLIIEIKFCKAKSGINNKHVATYEEDCQKMLEIHQRLYSIDSINKMHGIFVAFNKTNKGINIFNRFKEKYNGNPNIDIMYGTGNVTF